MTFLCHCYSSVFSLQEEKNHIPSQFWLKNETSYETRFLETILRPRVGWPGLTGEDKLRPYDFNHDWGSSVGADARSAQAGRMIIRPYYLPASFILDQSGNSDLSL